MVDLSWNAPFAKECNGFKMHPKHIFFLVITISHALQDQKKTDVIKIGCCSLALLSKRQVQHNDENSSIVERLLLDSLPAQRTYLFYSHRSEPRYRPGTRSQKFSIVVCSVKENRNQIHKCFRQNALFCAESRLARSPLTKAFY